MDNNQPSEDQSEDIWSSPNWRPRIEKIFVELLVEEMIYHPDVCVLALMRKHGTMCAKSSTRRRVWIMIRQNRRNMLACWGKDIVLWNHFIIMVALAGIIIVRWWMCMMTCGKNILRCILLHFLRLWCCFIFVPL